MTDLVRHPDTGLHYVMVVPSSWGAYVDIFAMYSRVERHNQWLSVVDSFEATFLHHRNDANVLFVCWSLIGPRAFDLNDRKCLVTGVYSEAYDRDRSKMIVDHQLHYDRFVEESKSYDAVFTHTPWMMEEVSRGCCKPGYVLPVGWDPLVMGEGRWRSPRRIHFLYWGSRAGRRELFLPYLQEKLEGYLVDGTGMFGRELLAKLDTAHAALYLAHSNVASYSTWRLWQSVATSACFVGEPGDTWPFEADKHFLTFGLMTSENCRESVDEIRRIGTDETRMRATARRAREEVGEKFIIDRVLSDWLIPASAHMLEVRRVEQDRLAEEAAIEAAAKAETRRFVEEIDGRYEGFLQWLDDRNRDAFDAFGDETLDDD